MNCKELAAKRLRVRLKANEPNTKPNRVFGKGAEKSASTEHDVRAQMCHSGTQKGGAKTPLEMLREWQAGRQPASRIFGPWAPDDPEAERRIVLDCEPCHWWWKPRYELAALMRGGMTQKQAVEKIRSEI